MYNIFNIIFLMLYNLSMENKIKIGEIIRSKRLQLNLRMDDIAKQVGITRMTLGSIENGSRNYTIDVLLKLLNVLNLSLDIGFSEFEGNRSRATRINSTVDKKINRFVVMCIEQYATLIKSSSKETFNILKENGIDIAVCRMIEIDYQTAQEASGAAAENGGSVASESINGYSYSYDRTAQQEAVKLNAKSVAAKKTDIIKLYNDWNAGVL